MADLTREPEEFDLDHFFFYDPAGVREWAADYYRSNYNPFHLPRPGVGMRKQHWTVRHDWRVWLNGLAWAQGQIAKERREKNDPMNVLMKELNGG